MSYQVLARKWRPSTFEEMVGQAHVLRALVNALDQQRLHHAYLFTGTRGVGKTTIARLLAKSLNCERGVGSKPCGVCPACTEIAEGRFIDLIEVDAASRTKVEDTRELLENVQYAPTRGRYKVYLIDEVHMLSTSSFNALLKTLEEPPPHVKFLLATTDPQKLPVTVLSRCLQFNLKNMSREHIVQHLTHILGVEQVPFDDASLWSIAEGAQGSMRDALSLTDQAIAFGQGALREQEVAAMLGTVDLKRVLKLTHALFEKNVDQLMALVADVDEHAPDYNALMTELMSTLHRVAIAQAAPNAIDNQKGDKRAIIQLAKAALAEDVHLYYQIAAKAKPEMSLAPSERAGFEMALLRMLAFSQTPAADVGQLPELTSAAPVIEEAPVSFPKSETLEPAPVSPAQPTVAVSPEPQAVVTPTEPEAVSAPQDSPVPVESVGPVVAEQTAAAEPEPLPTEALMESPEPEPEFEAVQVEPIAESQVAGTVEPEPVASEVYEDLPFDPDPVAEIAAESVATPETSSQPETAAPVVQPVVVASHSTGVSVTEILESGERVARWPETDREADPLFWWQVTLHRLGLTGMTKTLFAHSQWVGYDNDTLQLVIASNYRKIMNDNHRDRLLQALQPWLPGARFLNFEFNSVEQTPQMWVDMLVNQARDEAFQHLQNDPFVQMLIDDFNAELERESAQPNHNPIPTGA